MRSNSALRAAPSPITAVRDRGTPNRSLAYIVPDALADIAMLWEDMRHQHRSKEQV